MHTVSGGFSNNKVVLYWLVALKQLYLVFRSISFAPNSFPDSQFQKIAKVESIFNDVNRFGW